MIYTVRLSPVALAHRLCLVGTAHRSVTMPGERGRTPRHATAVCVCVPNKPAQRGHVTHAGPRKPGFASTSPGGARRALPLLATAPAPAS
jgi:hypothetical protein